MSRIPEQQVRETILAAFADVPYPGDEGIAGAEYVDHLDVQKRFAGVDWRELSFDMLQGDDDWPLNWMSDAALKYYLPGFMLLALDDLQGRGRGVSEQGDVLSHVLCRIAPVEDPPKNRALREAHERQAAMMSRPEAAAIVRWLEYVLQHLADEFDRELAGECLCHWRDKFSDVL